MPEETATAVVVRGGRSRPATRSGRTSAKRRRAPDPAQLVLELDLPAPIHPHHGARSAESSEPPGPRPGDAFIRSDAALAVMAFHEAFGLPRRLLPSVKVSEGLSELRISLLEEEVGEFAQASRERDLVGIADGLADIVYVAYGAAITYGIDLDAVLTEVHRSNMSKLDASGRPVLRADGKVIKSERYRPPNISGVLYQQLPLM